MERGKREYILLMECSENRNHIGQIVAIDNSTPAGKEKLQRMIMQGDIFVGRVTDCMLSPAQLRIGFSRKAKSEAETYSSRLNLIRRVLDGELDDEFTEEE